MRTTDADVLRDVFVQWDHVRVLDPGMEPSRHLDDAHRQATRVAFPVDCLGDSGPVGRWVPLDDEKFSVDPEPAPDSEEDAEKPPHSIKEVAAVAVISGCDDDREVRSQGRIRVRSAHQA